MAELEHLLSTVVHRTMPGNYVRESQRPRLAEVVSGARIPVIDLASPDRAAVVAAIGGACRTHGFFQVLNHGIDAGLTADVIAVAREFFRLPAEEKARLYSDDPARFVAPEWPSNPPDFKETVSSYCKEVQELGFRVYAVISESLRLEPSYMKETLGEQEQHTAVSFYPPCPSPELTYGHPLHTDPNALTILLMDKDVAALQVLPGGKWVAVDLQPAGALVVNIGDKLQLKNGFFHALGERSGGLCLDAVAVLQREPGGTRPHLGEDRASVGLEALDPNGTIVSVDDKNADEPPFVETLVVIGHVGEQGALYYSDDGAETESTMAEVFLGARSSTYAVQVRVDDSVGAKTGDPIGLAAEARAGEDDGRGNGHRGGRDNISAIVVGITAASSAVTAVAAGAVAPAVAFGFFVVLLSGLFLATMTTICSV